MHVSIAGLNKIFTKKLNLLLTAYEEVGVAQTPES